MSQTKFKVIENNNMDKENRIKSLEAAVGLIEKNYGKGSIMKLGSKAILDIESISTGSLGLDIALGIGGVPKGRIVEIICPEHTFIRETHKVGSGSIDKYCTKCAKPMERIILKSEMNRSSLSAS